MDNVIDIKAKIKMDGQQVIAREFLKGFAKSLAKVPKNDVAHLLAMVIADITQSVMADFHNHFCNKTKRPLDGKEIIEIIVDNLIAYTNHLHEQIISDESELKH